MGGVYWIWQRFLLVLLRDSRSLIYELGGIYICITITVGLLIWKLEHLSRHPSCSSSLNNELYTDSCETIHYGMHLTYNSDCFSLLSELYRSVKVFTWFQSSNYVRLIWKLVYWCQTSRDTKMGTFADDTAIFATHPDPMAASRYLQEHLKPVQNWLKEIENKGKRNQVIAHNLYP